MSKMGIVQKLRSRFQRRLSRKELDALLTDYEQRIHTKNGDPAVAAQELIEMIRNKNKPLFTVKEISRVLLHALWLILVVVYLNNLNYMGYIEVLRNTIFLYVAVIFAWWFALDGILTEPHESGTIRKWMFPAGHVFLVFSMLVYTLLLRKMGSMYLSVFSDAEWAAYLSYAYFVIRLWYVFVVIGLLVTVFALYGFFRSGIRYFTLMSHGAGALAYFYAIYFFALLRGNNSELSILLFPAMAVYGVSVLLTLAFALFIHFYRSPVVYPTRNEQTN